LCSTLAAERSPLRSEAVAVVRRPRIVSQPNVPELPSRGADSSSEGGANAQHQSHQDDAQGRRQQNGLVDMNVPEAHLDA